MYSWVGRLLMPLVGMVAVQTLMIDAAQAQCSGNEVIRVSCDDRGDDDEIRIRIKNGEPGATVTVRVTGDDVEEDFIVTLDDRGRAKLRVDVGDDDNKYTVTIVECGVSRRVKCDD